MAQTQSLHRPPFRTVMEAYVNITAATYMAKAGDRVIGVNRAGTVTLTLPTAELRPGRIYTIKDESGAATTNNITMATEGSETIDGSATDIISDDYGSKTYYSDGSNWFTVPLLGVGPHTLASHSAKAHSDLTGIGAGDHHAQAHKTDHEPAGPDAMTVDAAAGTGSLRTLGSGAQQGAAGDHTHAGGSDVSARVHHSVSQSIANATTVALAFNSERYDTDAIHDTATNNSRLTCKTAGKYIISTTIQWVNNSAGSRRVAFFLNGTTEIAVQKSPNIGADHVYMTVTTQYELAVNDYIEVNVFQDSGSSLNIISSTSRSPEFMMVKVLG